MEDNSFVPGVGDEVVLFLLFIVTSVIIVMCLSSRRNQSKVFKKCAWAA